ncbi:MAG TPA: DUF3310 domain-containing protein [Phycisphaerales bacterium]|jgi:hypothetical protein|nr:DUF3310 domain-containing protein [Phycisphaerales bacterium]
MTLSHERELAAAAPARPDPIQRPPHYTFSTIEPIQAIEAWQLGFHLGCVVKYVCRAGRKGDKVEDLQKARWYLDREIARLEQEQRS